MAKVTGLAGKTEKERLRAEIDRHTAEFLRRGGRIDVLTSHQQKQANVGSVWHQQNELANFTL